MFRLAPPATDRAPRRRTAFRIGRRPILHAWASMLLAPWLAASACAEADHRAGLAGGDADPGFVDLTIAALTFDGVGDALWDLRIATAGAATIAETRVSSARFGDGAGSLTFVGPCDASADANPNSVEVRLIGLYADPVTDIGAHGSAAPAGALSAQLPGRLTQEVICEANSDHPLRFDVTILRPAQQGFVDIAVNFNDLHCSAKYDCGAEDLLFDGASRSTTHILGFVCLGSDTAPTLYLDAIDIDCGVAGSVSLDPAPAADGNQGAVAIGDDRGLFQWAVFRGQESTGTAHRSYWNVALGVDELTGCTVSTRGAADRSDVLGDGVIPAGTVYPYVSWSVPLDGCTDNQPLTFTAVGEDPAPVTVTYTETTGAGLAFAFRFPSDPTPTCDDGVQNGDETDVDCGGSCDPCAVGATCDGPEDCATGICGPDDGGSCASRVCLDAPYVNDGRIVTCELDDDALYELHTFTGTGTHAFAPSPEVTAVEVLVVGGGGGGGASTGASDPAGGGAGGLVHRDAYAVGPDPVSLTVGAGGGVSQNGADSTFGTLVAIGGGAGGNDGTGAGSAGAPGGSGGGGGPVGADGGAALQPTSASGGAGHPGGRGDAYGEGGGGGGAGEPGGDACQSNCSPTRPGFGGDGLYFPQFSHAGSPAGWFAGGGSGGGEQGPGPVPAGLGGGGVGGHGSGASNHGQPGVPNTGGGGGGGNNQNGGPGGSGVVVVRFLVP